MTPPRSRFRFSLRAMFVAFTVLTLIVGGAFVILRMVEQTVLDAYRVMGTGTLLVEYMELHSGRWPKDWDDVQSFMTEHPSHYTGFSGFDNLRAHMEIDFSFDPTSVNTTYEFDEQQPPFRAVWLRNGKSTHWEGAGPNEMIFRHLKNQAERDRVESLQ